MNIVSYLFGGLFLVNAVPHFLNGIMGKSFLDSVCKTSGKRPVFLDSECSLEIR